MKEKERFTPSVNKASARTLGWFHQEAQNIWVIFAKSVFLGGQPSSLSMCFNISTDEY